MPESLTYNIDCMEAMRKIPDKYFDLAVVDPPYGIVTNGESVCIAVYSVVFEEFAVMCGKKNHFGVTHWMPLPEPPKINKGTV